MTIKLVKRPPNGAELRLEGRLDTTSAPSTEAAFAKVKSEYSDIILNFADLQYVSSAGLRVLLGLQKKVSASGGSLSLTHVSTSIMEVFEMTGFAGILNIVRD